MKNKFFFLSAIVTTCVLAIASNQSTAGEKKLACGGQQPAYQPAPAQQSDSGSAVTNPNMPTGKNSNGNGNVNGKRPCYPATKCTGDPNLIGGGKKNGNSGATTNNGGSANKVLQIQSAEKFTGTVKAINRVAMPNQTQIQMVLTTDQGDLLVVLGPASYIDQQKIKFQAGDKVVVTGYRVTANGNDVITAAKVDRNGSTLQLLNDQRQPVWGNQ